MPQMLIDIPKDLDHKITVIKAQNQDKTKQETIINLLQAILE